MLYGLYCFELSVEPSPSCPNPAYPIVYILPMLSVYAVVWPPVPFVVTIFSIFSLSFIFVNLVTVLVFPCNNCAYEFSPATYIPLEFVIAVVVFPAVFISFTSFIRLFELSLMYTKFFLCEPDPSDNW